MHYINESDSIFFSLEDFSLSFQTCGFNPSIRNLQYFDFGNHVDLHIFKVYDVIVSVETGIFHHERVSRHQRALIRIARGTEMAIVKLAKARDIT